MRPLTIASPVFLTGAIGLLTYLKRTRSLDINVDYVFYRSGEILEEGSAGRRGDLPDGFVCSAASLPDMLKRASRFDYVPLMLLPGVSSRVVSGGAQSNKTRAAKVQQLLVIGDLPTSGSIYAQKLVRSRVDRGAKIEITAVDAKTFEDSAPPHDEDFGLVMGFPTYHYHHRVNRSAFTDMPKSRENQLETVLFIKQELISDGTAIILDVMIRDAWLEVKEMPSKLSQLTSLIVDDTAYIKALNRLGGFYKVSDRTMNL